MNAEYVPQLLRTPDLGLFLSVHVGRKWSHIIIRDAREVAVKRVRNEVVTAAKVVDYPKGLVVAAEHFLKPELGIAVVTPQAKLILEEIMKVYSTKAAAKKGLVRMGGDVDQLDTLVAQVGDEWHLDDSKLTTPVRADARSKAPSKEQAEAVTKHFDNRPKVKVEKTLAEERVINMKKGAKQKAAASVPKVKRPIVIRDDAARTIAVIGDQSKRRGNFGLICAAVAKGYNTAEKIAKHVPEVTEAYIGQSISWGLKHGVFSAEAA